MFHTMDTFRKGQHAGLPESKLTQLTQINKPSTGKMKLKKFLKSKDQSLFYSLFFGLYP
ncbi:hypothetical protein GYH30_029041 [Glycine max]|uniref:Uncharacterized protein n=1 Tax=Glycine max TaxID=3847 RepID=K7LL96_SOYBN|nr:hypothetical protein GYH30_029041 [Glycine max]